MVAYYTCYGPSLGGALPENAALSLIPIAYLARYCHPAFPEQLIQIQERPQTGTLSLNLISAPDRNQPL
ncbi:MAG TPA: hypothetical protein EYF99_03645 [Pseudomonadales bacterium]|nr:hypothetical protein [Pseudomonadales bacterium]